MPDMPSRCRLADWTLADALTRRSRVDAALVDTPMSVTALSSSELARYQVDDLGGLRDLIPNLSANMGDAANAIDWERERLEIPDRKAGHHTAFPLSAIVGGAIVDYLRDGRPASCERALFLQAQAPFRPAGFRVISDCATRRLRNAGIQVARPGSHTLRHSCVQHLVEAQFPLKAIGDYLGHRRPKSTEVYAKLDLDALREVALGDGEELA